MELKQAYERLKHYHHMYGGVYVYTEYEKDLDLILDFVGRSLQTSEQMFDCAWGNPEGE